MSGNGEDFFDLRGQPQGNVEMVLFTERGKIIQRFERPMLFVAYEPGNAVQIGKKLIDCAVDCGARVEIQVPKRTLSAAQHAALVVRAAHVIRSLLLQQDKPLSFVAREVVDTILSATQ